MVTREILIPALFRGSPLPQATTIGSRSSSLLLILMGLFCLFDTGRSFSSLRCRDIHPIAGFCPLAVGILRYWYSSTTKRCGVFEHYPNCLHAFGNSENNFVTLDECQSVCDVNLVSTTSIVPTPSSFTTSKTLSVTSTSESGSGDLEEDKEEQSNVITSTYISSDYHLSNYSYKATHQLPSSLSSKTPTDSYSSHTKTSSVVFMMTTTVKPQVTYSPNTTTFKTTTSSTTSVSPQFFIVAQYSPQNGHQNNEKRNILNDFYIMGSVAIVVLILVFVILAGLIFFAIYFKYKRASKSITAPSKSSHTYYCVELPCFNGASSSKPYLPPSASPSTSTSVV